MEHRSTGSATGLTAALPLRRAQTGIPPGLYLVSLLRPAFETHVRISVDTIQTHGRLAYGGKNNHDDCRVMFENHLPHGGGGNLRSSAHEGARAPTDDDGQGMPWNYSLRGLLYPLSYCPTCWGRLDSNQQQAITHNFGPSKRERRIKSELGFYVLYR